jgi:hypothetical protein
MTRFRPLVLVLLAAACARPGVRRPEPAVDLSWVPLASDSLEVAYIVDGVIHSRQTLAQLHLRRDQVMSAEVIAAPYRPEGRPITVIRIRTSRWR